jgi:superfamily II DNA or RNA helicase
MVDLIERARNRQVELRGHFTLPVRVETVEQIGEDLYLVRVRTGEGSPSETQVTGEELEEALARAVTAMPTAAASDLFLWVEGHRIRYAYAHDPYFAVSLSGIRGLPHQIEAVYRRLLPQPRLRFVLADDPGAGKTIMAGLLLKELKLRGVVDRTLIVAPAPLLAQWQDELYDKFDERFEAVSSQQVRWQPGGNPWERYQQVVTSLDFAKRDDVLAGLLRAEWDLVIIDEAHKCSAVRYSDKLEKTRRYVLAEELSLRAERLLLLTATPHSGDANRFTNFLALLEPDQFSTVDLVKRQIAVRDSPYFLRRQKEDLIDERGHRLFVPRTVHTQPFTLSPEEKALYDQVTDYINRFLGQAAGSGGRGNAVALARTVLQRRLASSLGAIRSSLAKRADRLEQRADELERLSPAERRRRLAELRLLETSDEETGVEDADEAAEEAAATEVAVHEHVDGLRAEVRELRALVVVAGRIDPEREQKLAALRQCLANAELAELRDGRGKLLIFTEHRDTLEHLARHLREWGYSVCTIHGGHPPAARKQLQHEFRTSRQVCVATEAAGEGINLQFCHLMINYDLPWNPVRLEQRMGRVHRIGQDADVVVFNFCATNTIEGELLQRLHAKLEEMRAALGGRVYDVIGDLLERNGLDFERLVKETLANPGRKRSSLERISALSPELLERYERDIGVAQATRTVDLEWVRRNDWASQERRLMPEYVERFFLEAAERAKLRVERREDGLYRVEHVPIRLRGDDLASVRRLGPPEVAYRKLTFHKEQREQAEHEDAVLCSPGHPLFAALAEALDHDLEAAGLRGAAAPFIDPAAASPYRIHFLAFEVIGERAAGGPETALAELVAVIEEPGGVLARCPADVLHDLTPADGMAVEPPDEEAVRLVVNWVRAKVQQPATVEERRRRLDQAELRAAYLEEAFAAQRAHLERRWSEYDERVYRGEERYRLQRDDTERRLAELERRRKRKLEGFGRLGVVRAGPVTYLGTAVVWPPARADEPAVRTLRPDPEVERVAMAVAMAHERAAGRDPEDVSARHDGSGFDLRSVRRDPASGEVVELRRIEVKGRSAPHGDVGLYRTEWYAAQRFRDGYWLYVVYSAGTGRERLVTVQDPWGRLRGVEEITQVVGYRVPGPSVEAAGREEPV